MTPDYELQEHTAQILEAHRMRELESIDLTEDVHRRIWEYYRRARVKKVIHTRVLTRS